MEENQQTMIQQQENGKNNIFSQLINMKTILSDQKNFRCLKNNTAQIVCSDPNCQKPGLCCGQRKCQCQTQHKTCKTIFLWRVTQSILQRPQEISGKEKQSFKALIKNINTIIEQISELRANLESQFQYFGLFKNELKFVELVRDNKINQISGKLINLVQSNLQNKVYFDLPTQNQINEDFQKTIKQFRSLIKEIQSKYSKKIKKNIKFDELFQNSQILTNQEQRNLLSTWIKQIPYDQNFKNLTTQLLFRASQHQFKSSQFVKYCQGKQNTITIIKNQFDKILGAYACPKWNFISGDSDNYIKDQKNRSFLFSLDQKIQIKCQNPQYCLRSNKIGPNFGKGDLYLYDMSNLHSKSGFDPFNMYNITKVNEKYQRNEQTYLLLTGRIIQNFKVKQYQIYQIVEK